MKKIELWKIVACHSRCGWCSTYTVTLELWLSGWMNEWIGMWAAERNKCTLAYPWCAHNEWMDIRKIETNERHRPYVNRIGYREKTFFFFSSNCVNGFYSVWKHLLLHTTRAKFVTKQHEWSLRMPAIKILKFSKTKPNEENKQNRNWK